MVKQKLDIGLFSCMYSQTNGTAHSVRFLSEALANTGHNVHVFAPKIQNGYKKPKNLYSEFSKDFTLILILWYDCTFACP